MCGRFGEDAVIANQSCLIIEDSEAVRKVMRASIEGLGFTVDECADTGIALTKVKKALPNVIVLDWHIPGCVPLEFIPAVRSIPGGRHVKVLYVMTNNDPVEVQRAITSGADAYMFKPFPRVTLEAKIALLTTPVREEFDVADYLSTSTRIALAGR